MAECMITRRGGSSKINGIIESYKVERGKAISAGDFVNFVQELNAVDSVSLGSYNPLKENFYAVALTSTTLLMVYISNAGGDNTDVGRVQLLQISGGEISFGNSLKVADKVAYMQIAKLSETKALIVYSDKNNLNYGTAVVIETDGTTITKGMPVVFKSASSSQLTLLGLSSTRAVVAYVDGGNNDYGTMVLLDISGTTIAVRTPLVFSTDYSTSCYTLVRLTDTQFTIFYYLAGDISMAMNRLTVAGNNIYAVSSYTFPGNGVEWITATKVEDDKIVLFYDDYTYESNQIRAHIITVSPNTYADYVTPAIIAGSVTTEIYWNMPKYWASTLPDNRVVLTAVKNDGTLESTIYDMDGLNLKPLGSLILNSTETIKYVSSAVVSDSVLVLYISDISEVKVGSLSLVSSYEVVTPAIGQENIKGVAKKAGTGGDIIDVYTL